MKSTESEAAFTSQIKLKANFLCVEMAQHLSPVRQSHKRAFIISIITCHQIRMMELTNGISLKPGNFVTEVSIEHVESGLR